METKPYLIRNFDPATDYETLVSWWDDHGSGRPAPALDLLPRLGLVALRETEPEAMAFLYLAANVGVSFIEFPVTRPGLGLVQSRAAFDAIVTVLKSSARSLDYGYMLAYTMPAIARELRRHGFKEGRKGMTMTIASTA